MTKTHIQEIDNLGLTEEALENLVTELGQAVWDINEDRDLTDQDKDQLIEEIEALNETTDIDEILALANLHGVNVMKIAYRNQDSVANEIVHEDFPDHEYDSMTDYELTAN